MASADPRLAADALPSPDDLRKIAALDVFDEAGRSVRFGGLYEQQKTIVVFIRHFHCGLCAQYVQALNEALPQDKLEHAGVGVVVVGCGSWEPIKQYREDWACRFPVFADPQRALYRTLRMTQTLAMAPKGQQKRSYLKMTQGQQVWSSFKKAVANIGMATKTGNFTQNGGELVLGPGAETCSSAHRMQNTEDHREVADLLRAAGIEGGEGPQASTTAAAAAAVAAS